MVERCSRILPPRPPPPRYGDGGFVTPPLPALAPVRVATDCMALSSWPRIVQPGLSSSTAGTGAGAAFEDATVGVGSSVAAPMYCAHAAVALPRVAGGDMGGEATLSGIATPLAGTVAALEPNAVAARCC